MSEKLTKKEVEEFLQEILRQSGLEYEKTYPIEIEKLDE